MSSGSGHIRSWWGWGYEDEALGDQEIESLARLVAAQFGLDGRVSDPPPISALDLRAPRVEVPSSLAGIASVSDRDRARHAHGSSYSDVVRALAGSLPNVPDAVLRPRSATEVAAVLDWCSGERVAAVPFGGGSSVVGGVEPDVGDGFRGAVSVDLEALSGVYDVDAVSLGSRIGGGTLGPELETGLKEQGMTLRHFPQSFECSTLGGWIATRAGGHFATGPTHIDDLVESMEVVTPAGLVETRRLPASGAGPDPNRLLIGSEGALGIITAAWVRVRPRPRWRAGGSARFPDFPAGARALRALAQSGLEPANCRLVDPLEALVNGAGDGSSALVIVGFESADHPLDAWATRAEECVKEYGGTIEGDWGCTEQASAADRGGPAAAWRGSFMRAPYVRDALVRLGVLCETFETAVTWDRFEELHSSVRQALESQFARGGVPALATCRATHVYPDGAAPYFTVLARALPGAEMAQWKEMKEVASDAVMAAGGTITHHHAVGRDHRRWYDEERPGLFAQAIEAAKSALDPAWICNPGVLVDRRRA